MPTQAEVDALKTRYRNDRVKLREQIEELEASCEQPMTGGRVAMRVGQLAARTSGAAIAGQAHEADLGPVRGKTVTMIVGGIGSLVNCGTKPDGVADLLLSPFEGMWDGNMAVRRYQSSRK